MLHLQPSLAMSPFCKASTGDPHPIPTGVSSRPPGCRAETSEERRAEIPRKLPCPLHFQLRRVKGLQQRDAAGQRKTREARDQGPGTPVPLTGLMNQRHRPCPCPGFSYCPEAEHAYATLLVGAQALSTSTNRVIHTFIAQHVMGAATQGEGLAK